MKRLLGYLKPHKWIMALATLMVLLIIVVDLYRPIIIGNAIDGYINGYDRPFAVTEDAEGAVRYGERWLVRVEEESLNESGEALYQMFLYENHYYMAEGISAAQAEQLRSADYEELAAMSKQAVVLSKEQLKELRKNDFVGILHAAVLYLLLMLAGFLLNMANNWTLQKMGQNIIFTMREQVFSHIHSLSLAFFNNTPVGTLVTRVVNDTESVNELFTSILINLFKNSVKIIGYAVVMISINLRMALVSFLFLPAVAVVTFALQHFSRKAYQVTRNRITELNTYLSEHISSMRLIQIFGREEHKYLEFTGKSQRLFEANWKEVMTFATFRPIIYLISVLALIAVVGTGSYSVLHETLSLGTLFVFITYIGSFFDPIQELAEQFGTLQSSLASAEKIFTILDVQPDIANPAEPVPVNIQGRIEFEHVWFAYEGENWILRDVSFVIEPGQKVAFVGATGAGKSTILNLIGRYFDIQSGTIRIDGVDIRSIDKSVLRGAIGQVQQDVFIFTGDIKSNISLGNEAIGMDEVQAAAETVNAASFIEKLECGYDEPVTERGSTLSTGQRQLLSFARTLAYHPTILVLDEATANIDTETESLITNALEHLMEGRTTIMVAHRLSTIQHADNIIVMHHGKIRESGNHQELLARGGLYRRLYELQLV